MSAYISKTFCLFIIFLSLHSNIFAQIKQVNSPYSISGIGDIHPIPFAFNRAMGGVGAALRTTLNINNVNPASYSALQLTTFELALQANSLWLNTNTQQKNTATGSLSYLALAFPVNKYWGAGIGLMPYSYLHYDITTPRNLLQTEDTVQYRFLGSGQLYQFYIGNGVKYKAFSAGVNVGYIFGTQTRQLRQTFPTIDNTFSNIRTQDIFPRGFNWNAGLQYEFTLTKKLNLVWGAAGNTAININSTQNTRWERAQVAGDRVSVVDTLYLTDDEKGKITLPLKLTTGLSLQSKSQWLISADVSWEPWQNFRFYNQPDASLANNLRVAVGGSIIPTSRLAGGFWEAAAYNAGFYYATGRLTRQNLQLPEWGITIGMGMPLKRVRSRLNFAFELGQRGTLQNDLIKETSLLATFGFTLNDRWFIKRKYD